MSSDIRSILQRIVAIEEGTTTPATVKSGLNAQQKSVPQLPALFKPKSISVLGAKTDPAHPMKGYAVGADESVETKKSALEEAMANIEEDMLSKVKADLNTYLDRLEKKIADDGKRDKDATTDLDRLEKKTRIDRDLIDKAVSAVDKGQAESEEELEEDPTQDASADIGQPDVPIQEPVLPEAAVLTVGMDDGSVLECYGNERDGFEIRRGANKLPTRFPKLDHARMAMDLYKLRRNKEERGQDYMEER